MEKMEIYNAAREVPQEAQKAFDNGTFKGTDINPMWRIKKLTELFGMCGIGWYYDVLSERSETYVDTVMSIVDLNLYVKVDGEWSKPIYGTGGNALVKETRNGLKPSDEGYKMALTDALSVACKALGIGANIYFEKDKYTDAAPKREELNPDLLEEAQHIGILLKNVATYFKKQVDDLTNEELRACIEAKKKAIAKKAEATNDTV